MTTPVDINVGINGEEPLRKVGGALNEITKTLATLDGNFTRYSTSLKSLLAQLDKVSRVGAPGQTARDLQLLSGGTTIKGRVQQSLQRAQISDMRQIEEVLAADLVNRQRAIFKEVSKSIQSTLVRDFARQRQTIISDDLSTLRSQIEAQTARVSLATQLDGRQRLNRGRIVQNAASIGIENLGTLSKEKAALDALLATEKRITTESAAQLRDARALLSVEERIKRLTDERFATLRTQARATQISSLMGQQDIRAVQAGAAGNTGGVLNANAKKEALRLEQMILNGVKEESREYQEQLGKIRQLNVEKAKLRDTQAKITSDTREQTALDRSRRFASGDDTLRQTAINNMIGGRQAAGSMEGRASLLGLQANLLLNYSLIGAVTGALTGMSSAVVELDAQMRQLQAISGATNAEYLKMKEAIIDASTETKFSAVELAEGATLLAQVGMSAQQIQEVLPVVSNFAMAVGTDMKTAVDITTTALTVFNMSASETQRVTNVMAEALNRSKLSMDQLTLGFQYAANITADAGGTFEELTAVLAGMSQAGIRAGSMLGTGLRQIMISLAAPTEEVKQLLSDLGLTMNDVDVRTQGLVGVLQNFHDAGITAGQAMAVFETRTAAALIAATNQVDFMRQLQEQFIYTNAAEEAARVQKDALKNSVLELKNQFLAFVNEAAAPVLAFLIGTAKATQTLGEILSPISGLLAAVGTAIIALTAVAAGASLIKLVGTFFQFSGVLVGIPPLLAGVRSAMLAFSASTVVTATGTTAAATAVGALRVALSALMLHPLVLAITAVVGVAALLTNGFGLLGDSVDRQRQRMDELKTEYDESQAKLSHYQDALGQVDATLSRLSSRSGTLKNDKQALRIEVLQAGIQFNQYGASIRDTTIDLDGLTSSLYKARQGVLDLMYAEAMRSNNNAQRSAVEASNQTKDNLGTAMRNLDGMSIRRIQASLTGDALRQFNSDIQYLRTNPRATDQNSAFRISQATSNVEGQLQRLAQGERNAGGFLSDVRAGNLQRRADLFGNAGQSAFTAGSQYQTRELAQRQVAEQAARRTPAFQALERSLSPGVTASTFNSEWAEIERLRRTNPAEADRRQAALFSSYRDSNSRSQAAEDAIRERLRTGNLSEGERAALNTILSGSTASGEAQTAARTAAREQQTKVGDAAGTLLQALRGNANISQVQAAAASVGIALPGDRAGAMRTLGDLKAKASSGVYADELLGTSNAMNTLNYGVERLATTAPGRGGGGANAAEQAERAARDAKRLSDAAASSFNRLSSASEKGADLLLRGIDGRTSPEKLQETLAAAQAKFDDAENYQATYYETKLQGMREYRDSVVRAGAVTKEELQDLNAEIANVTVEAEEAAKNLAEEINQKMMDAMAKIPEFGKPFSRLLDAVDRILSNLEVELQSALIEVNQLAANRSATSTLIERAARQGRVLGNAGELYDLRSQRLQDQAENRADNARYRNNVGRRDALTRALSAPVGNVMGQSIDLNNIDAALGNARFMLGNMQLNTDEYRKQSLLVKDLEGAYDRIQTMRKELITVEQDITAYNEAQLNLAQAAGMNRSEQIKAQIETWSMSNNLDTFNPISDAISNIPEVLTKAQGAFQTFFSDVLTGTASVGDAFRAMSVSILQAMMDVISSAIAKSFMKMLVNAGMKFFGGTYSGPTAASEGLEFYNTGGMIRAAGGTAVRGRDSVPILAMPGEYVLRKSAVDAIGVDQLNALNANGNKVVSGQNAVQPVKMLNSPEQDRPLNIYVVSQDKQPIPSKDEIIIMVQEDMINRGPVYKTTRAIQQGTL